MANASENFTPPDAASHRSGARGLIWDEAAFRDRFGDDAELWRAILDAFFQDVPQRLQKLRDAFERRDRKEIGSAAHYLKGSTATISAQSLMEMARHIEEQSEFGDIDSASKLASVMEQEVVELRRIVSAKGIAGT